LTAISAFLCCLTVHEGGHALAAYLTGGAIRDFVLLSLTPHVLVYGGSTPAHEAFRAAAGSVCSLFCAFLYLLAGPRSTAGWRLARNSVALFAGVELLGWFLSALTQTFTSSPDDAQHFLAASGLSPLAVLAICAALAALALAAFKAGRPAESLRPRAAAAAASRSF
jgi:hypothetical protein